MPFPEKWIFVGPEPRLTRSWPDARADCGRQADSSPGIRGQLHEQALRGFAGAILADCHFATALMPRPLLVLANRPVPRAPCPAPLPIVSRRSSSGTQEC